MYNVHAWHSCIWLWAYVCIYTYICIYIHTCRHTYIHTYLVLHACLHECIYIIIYIYIYIHTCYVYIHACIYVHGYTDINIYLCIYTQLWIMGFCLSTWRCTCASRMRHRRFPGAKGARLHSSNTVAAEFTGSEPSRLEHLECMYCRRKFTDPE